MNSKLNCRGCGLESGQHYFDGADYYCEQCYESEIKEGEKEVKQELDASLNCYGINLLRIS